VNYYITVRVLSTPSLGITYQLEIDMPRIAYEAWAFNSLSRDHKRAEIPRLPSQFPCGLSTPSLGITRQLSSVSRGARSRSTLSTPSLGITKVGDVFGTASDATFNSLSRDHYIRQVCMKTHSPKETAFNSLSRDHLYVKHGR